MNLNVLQKMRILKLLWAFIFLLTYFLRFWLLGACQLSYDHHIDVRKLLYVETTNFYIFYVSLDNRHILRTIFLKLSKFLKIIFFWIFWILSNFLCAWCTTILKTYETCFYAHEEFFLSLLASWELVTTPQTVLK